MRHYWATETWLSLTSSRLIKQSGTLFQLNKCNLVLWTREILGQRSGNTENSIRDQSILKELLTKNSDFVRDNTQFSTISREYFRCLSTYKWGLWLAEIWNYARALRGEKGGGNPPPPPPPFSSSAIGNDRGILHPLSPSLYRLRSSLDFIRYNRRGSMRNPETAASSSGCAGLRSHGSLKRLKHGDHANPDADHSRSHKASGTASDSRKLGATEARD